jgi:hypothetical protein
MKRALILRMIWMLRVKFLNLIRSLTPLILRHQFPKPLLVVYDIRYICYI